MHDDLAPPPGGVVPLAATQTSSARCLAQLSGRCGNRVARTPQGRLCTVARLSPIAPLGLVSHTMDPARWVGDSLSGPGGPSGSHPVGSGVLAMLTDPGLRDELDRVAAAVGVRVVHLGGRHPVSRKTWSAAAAVVLDHAAADRCGRLALPRRTHVSVLTGTEAATATWAAAITVGAQHVLRMPEQEGELVRELAEAAESARDDGICGAVVAVIGVAVALGHRCLRLPWRRPPLMRCWSISIRGPAASIFWWAAKPPPVCVGPTWRYRVDG